MNERKRYVYMDVLRVAACMSVIYNHTQEYGFFLFATREPGSMQYFVELFVSMLCKFAVPVFLALSGALMLGRKACIKTLWQKRIPRIALVLAVFSAVYYGVEVAAGRAQAGIRTFIFGVYESGWGYALWYLYAYLAFLMILPVLSSLAKALDDRTFLYLFALVFVFRCLIPGFEAYRWEGMHKLHQEINLTFLTSDIVLYPLLGYFLHQKADKVELRKALPVLCVASVLLTAVSCMMTYRDYERTWVVYTQTYHNLFAPVLCAAVFSLSKVAFGDANPEGRVGRMMAWLSRYTFGVYLIHPLIVENLRGFGGMFDFISMTGILPLLGSLLYCLMMMIISLLSVCLLRKIPLLNRLIF